MNDFIKQQQELASHQLLCMWPSGEELTKETLNTMELFITNVIQNTGEELQRLAEGERTGSDFPDYGGGYDAAIDTLRKHITKVTGVE